MELIYLDNAATSYPKPGEVHDFMCSFYRNYGFNPGRSGYDLSVEAEGMVQKTRKMLTGFFNGGDYNRLTFSYNASDSLNMIIQGIVRKGDHVVTTKLEHNSVLRPLHHLASDGLIEVTYVPFDENGFIDPDDIRKSIRKNTRLVVVNHGSNVIGTVQPIAEIGPVCRDSGVLFAVDASQTAGAIPIDVDEMQIDLLAFTGHKGLMGPTGIGGMYTAGHVTIQPTRFGGTGVRSAHKFHLEEYPYRMECGTLNLMGVAGLHAGQLWLEKEGVTNVHRKEMNLWEKLAEGLKEIDGVELYCADGGDDRNAVLSFNVSGWEASDVGTLLDVDYNIACRTGLQCAPLVHEQLGTDRIKGTVRFSIGPFNTESHIETAVQAVGEIAAMRRK